MDQSGLLIALARRRYDMPFCFLSKREGLGA